MKVLWLWLLFISTYTCASINEYFDEINENVKVSNSIAANITWESSLDPCKEGLEGKAAIYQQQKILWQHGTCRNLLAMRGQCVLNTTQERQAYLLCRGPIYYYKEAREMSKLYEDLRSIYSNIEACLPNSEHTTNMAEIEAAIMNYVSNTTEYLKVESAATSIDGVTKTSANGDKNGSLCIKGEEDFERIMEFSRKPVVLKWVWSVWREKVKGMRVSYRRFVDLENKGARRNGYQDIGESWREELEIQDLRRFSYELYSSVQQLYSLLHGVVRFFLRREYGDAVEQMGPIPAHLLGNLWSESWEPLSDLILPDAFDLDVRVKKLGWKVDDMVKRTEDFYVSLGLPAMTDAFWRESVFSRTSHQTARCHGTAADMFKDGDFRLLYCSGVSLKDYYVIHHEMGHVQYYMAYENQPAIFRQANTALHESIGDTIMFGVMTPQHLHRIRLINDSELYTSNTNNIVLIKDAIKSNKYTDGNQESYINFKVNPHEDYKQVTIRTSKTYNDHKMKNGEYPKMSDYVKYKKEPKYGDINKLTLEENNNILTGDKDVEDVEETLDVLTPDEILMFKQALNKLPQIPFSLLMDEYRWRYFEGSLNEETSNQEFWALARELQGIVPPDHRGEDYFDVGAKFHVPDNTPYIRYFLSSFLQHQLFESLCKAAVFGHRNVKEPLPDTISLNRCDIYGSKAAGKILKDIMSRGASQNIRQILQETTGNTDISSSSLKRYYRPLYKLLTRIVEKYDIPIGW